MRVTSTDEIFIRADPQRIARALLDLSDDASWWPGARAQGGYGWLALEIPTGARASRVRIKLSVGPVREWEAFTWFLEDGELRGRAEWWLQRFGDGTIVHYYLDCERGPSAGRRRLSSIERRHRWAVRRGINALKDRLEDRSRA